MREAQFYKKIDNHKVQCLLCPHFCTIATNESGFCRVRSNKDGILYADNYSILSALNIDPIEKKPLYHFFPGKKILSLGSFGCNLHCQFCQNWQISQHSSTLHSLRSFSNEQIIDLAKKDENIVGIAFTYNEPIVWFEYMKDLAIECKKAGLKTVMVTNGFINKEPLKQLLELIDAFSIDLKSFENQFYKSFTSSKLQPVLNTIKFLKQENKFIELTNLVISNLNDKYDNFSEMTDWINTETGSNTVLHISRYFPNYNVKESPTNISTLYKFYEIAKQKLDYVYIGNIQDNEAQNTKCPKCNEILISRRGYATLIKNIDEKGFCKSCKTNLNNDFIL